MWCALALFARGFQSAASPFFPDKQVFGYWAAESQHKSRFWTRISRVTRRSPVLAYEQSNLSISETGSQLFPDFFNMPRTVFCSVHTIAVSEQKQNQVRSLSLCD
jgi:hypothetical protein